MPLLKIAFKNITTRPGRFLLTSLAVLIGVALTTTVFVFTDSLRETFGGLSQDIESGYDIAVRSEIPFGERLTAAPVDLVVPDLLANIDGVAAIQPRVIQFGVVPNDANGEAVLANGPNIGVNWEDQSPVPRLFLVDGSPPAAAGEFALDAGAAVEDNFVIGETYGIQTPGGLVESELTGTFNFADPDENALIGAKLVAFDTATAVQLLNDGRGYDDVTMTLAEGTNEADVIAATEAVLPNGLEVLPRQVLADEQAGDFNDFINIFRTVLLVFAFIILMVAAFIIYNVFSIIVGQRIQEIGLLRALGASGTQITRSIAAEAFGVGVFATIAGLALGIPLAAGLQALLSAADFGPDTSATPMRPTTVIVAVTLGIGLTMVSAIWPAMRARRVSPMAALRSDVRLSADVQTNTVLGAILTLAGVLSLVLGFVLDDYILLLVLAVTSGILLYLGLTRINRVLGRFSLVSLSLALLIVALTANLRSSMLLALLGTSAFIAFLGMNLLSPLFATPVTRALGYPVGKLGIPGRLARENAGRSPRRTATAASALMIGLALVTMVAVVAQSFKATFADVLREAVSADWVIIDDSRGPGGGFSTAVGSDLESSDEFTDVLRVRYDSDAFRTPNNGKVRSAYATDLSSLSTHFDPGFVGVDEQLLNADGLLLHEDPAKDLDLGVGDRVDVQFVDLSTTTLTIAGIYDDLAVFDSGWIVDEALFDEHITANLDIFVTAITAPGVSEDEARAELEAAVSSFSQLEPKTKAEFQDAQESQINQALVVINALLGVSVVLALLGVGITLALSVFERTREIGLTRAVGATRKQIKRMIRGEGIIIALFGGVLGVGLGLVFGVAVVQIAPDDFVNATAIPWGSIVVYMIVAAVAGIIAAYFPGRRAAKLNVLEAISHE